jgi:hypothetical protein
MITKTIYENDFRTAFENIRPNNFTYDGIKALYDYLEEYSESTGENVELDVIAICCDFTEYVDMEEIAKNYSELKDIEDDERLEWLQDRTQVIQFDGGIILENF